MCFSLYITVIFKRVTFKKVIAQVSQNNLYGRWADLCPKITLFHPNKLN